MFSFLVMGLLVSMENGITSAEDSVRLFFNAANCLYIRKQMRVKLADEIMSRGVQLPDVIEILPGGESHRAFQHELASMRALCLKLLESRLQVA